MKNARAAIRYAKAILNLAKDTNSETDVYGDMKLVVATIAENHQLDVVLKSPVMKAKDKINVLKALFTDKVDNITLGLFNLLEENKRIAMLTSIAKQYAIIYDFDKQMQVATVTSAVALTKEIEAQVLAKVMALTGKKANLENVINPAILGGFILRVGDVQYDASISNHLNELKKEFDNSHYIPKI